MKMMIRFVAFYVILWTGSAVDAASRREIVIDTLLSRVETPKGLSNSAPGAPVDLSKPFAVSNGLQGTVDQDDFFTKWKQFYGFIFKTSEDEATVKATFKKEQARVEEHNKRFDSGLEFYRATVNGLSGLGKTDFELVRTGLRSIDLKRTKLNRLGVRIRRRTTRPTTTTKLTTTTKPPTTTAPNNITEVTVDYRTSPYYTAVKDQGMCGSCWAFAVIAPMEFQINMLYNITTADLSEQQLVDCDTTNWGCNGGWPHYVYRNLIGNGLAIINETSYKYTAVQGSCKGTFSKGNYKVTSQTANVSGGSGGWGTGTEAELEALVRKGPVVVAIYASTLNSYLFGIFIACVPGSVPNHAVVVVGFGIENGKAYWIVRNSWGVAWGENGHFRMEKGSNMCSVTYYYTIPSLASSA